MDPSDLGTKARFMSIEEGAVLSGDVDVPVEMTGSNGPPGSIFLDIDDGLWHRPGHPEWSGPDEVWSPIRWIVPFAVPTQYFSNGPHKLYVLVYPESNRRIADQRTVSFSNQIQNVSIRGLMDRERMSCPITALLATPQPWTVEIRRNIESVVRSWSRDGEAINVLWDGNDQDGKPVMRGHLHAVIKALQSGETAGEKRHYLIINLNR